MIEEGVRKEGKAGYHLRLDRALLSPCLAEGLYCFVLALGEREKVVD
jgi:hypothetical protein